MTKRSMEDMDIAMEVDDDVDDATGREDSAMVVAGAGPLWKEFMPAAANRETIIASIQSAFQNVSKLSFWKKSTMDQKVCLILGHLFQFEDQIEPEDIRPALEILEGSDVSRGPISVGKPAVYGAAQGAFEVDYHKHEDDTKFLEHLECQRRDYLAHDQSGRAPYFAVIQSSGYGKSRMIDNVKKTNSDYRVVYWSFGSEAAYPRKNVTIASDFRSDLRSVLEAAFAIAIANAIQSSTLETKYARQPNVSIELPETRDTSPSLEAQTTQAVEALLKGDNKAKLILVFDEVSNLLEPQTSDGVSFFRCLGASLKRYFGSQAGWLFSVVVATHSSITLVSTGSAFDASFKPVSSQEQQHAYSSLPGHPVDVRQRNPRATPRGA